MKKKGRLETFLSELALLQVKNNHEVIFLLPVNPICSVQAFFDNNGIKSIIDYGVRLTNLNYFHSANNGFFFFLREAAKYYLRLFILLRDYRPDLITVGFCSFMLPILIRFIGLIVSLKPKVIWRQASPIPDSFEGRMVKEFISKRFSRIRIASWFVDVIICISENLKKGAMNRGVHRKKMVTIYNGIDTEIHNRGSINTLLGKDLFSSSDIIISLCSKIEYMKGLFDFLEMVSILTIKVGEKLKNIKFMVIGEGKDSVRIEEQIIELGLKKYINLIGYRNDVLQLLRASDIFLFPTLAEAFGLVAIEAMAQQLPVVGYNVGGVPEIVIDGETGYLVPRGNTAALGEKIMVLIENPSLRIEMGRKGRERVLKNFDQKNMIKKYFDLYENIIGRSSKSAKEEIS